MGYHAGLNDLRDMFVVLYSNKNKAHMVLGEAGISGHLIDFDGSAIEFWRSILEFAQSNNQVQKIIDVARGHFPGNRQLVEAERIFHETPEPSISMPCNREHVPSNAPQNTVNVEGGNSGIIAGGNVMGVRITNVGDVSGNKNQIGNSN